MSKKSNLRKGDINIRFKVALIFVDDDVCLRKGIELLGCWPLVIDRLKLPAVCMDARSTHVSYDVLAEAGANSLILRVHFIITTLVNN